MNETTINDNSLVPAEYSGKVYLRRRECAAASGLSVAYFERLAWLETGPKFVKTSPRGPALYLTREFFEWLQRLGSEDSKSEKLKSEKSKSEKLKKSK